MNHRYRWRAILPIALTVVVLGACAEQHAPLVAPAGPIFDTKESQAALKPEAALARLRQGNERFLAGRSIARDQRAAVQATSHGQYPFAAVLSCMDSRVPPEIVFDQGIGNLFSVRVAGNVVNEDELGSLEYGVLVAGAKVIVILGHTSCGAIKGACDAVELGNLTGLLQRIRPALDQVHGVPGERTSKNHEFVDAVAQANVEHSMQELRAKSPLLDAKIRAGELLLVGAMYDLETGRVSFLERH